MTTKIKNKTTIILAVLLLLALGYIADDKFTESRQKDMIGAYQKGIIDGQTQAVIAVMQESAKCQPVTLRSGNTTLEVVATACLKPAE